MLIRSIFAAPVLIDYLIFNKNISIFYSLVYISNYKIKACPASTAIDINNICVTQITSQTCHISCYTCSVKADPKACLSCNTDYYKYTDPSTHLMTCVLSSADDPSVVTCVTYIMVGLTDLNNVRTCQPIENCFTLPAYMIEQVIGDAYVTYCGSCDPMCKIEDNAGMCYFPMDPLQCYACAAGLYLKQLTADDTG